MKKQRTKFKGFTLAELTVVVSIIAIVATISVKIAKSKSSYETKVQTYSAFMNLKQAAGEIMADGYFDSATTRKEIPHYWDYVDSPGKMFGFCQRLAVPATTDCNNCGILNTIGTVNCGASYISGATTDFNPLTPHFITTNGQRFFASSASIDSTNPYYLFIDINGAKKPNLVNKDVLRFFVTEAGEVAPDPYSSAATSTNYLSADVRIYSSGTPTYIKKNVSFREAACTAGLLYPSGPDCGGFTQDTTNCPTANNPCNVYVNKPGY